jgi:hypothetical protein
MKSKTVTLTDKLLAAIQESGKQNERTISQEIRYHLEKIYQEQEEKGKKITA